MTVLTKYIKFKLSWPSAARWALASPVWIQRSYCQDNKGKPFFFLHTKLFAFVMILKTQAFKLCVNTGEMVHYWSVDWGTWTKLRFRSSAPNVSPSGWLNTFKSQTSSLNCSSRAPTHSVHIILDVPGLSVGLNSPATPKNFSLF